MYSILTCVLGIMYSIPEGGKSSWRKIKSEMSNVSVAKAKESLISKSGREYVVRAKNLRNVVYNDSYLPQILR